MELTEVMRTTAAIRDFEQEEVDDACLQRILDVARFAPSGGNRQPWRVVVVKDRDVRQELRRLYQLSWREYAAHIDQGLVPFAPSSSGRYEGPAVDLEKARSRPAPSRFADTLEDVPVLLVLFAHLPSLAVLDNGLDRQSIVGGGSVYPFGHNLLLAARDEGLGGVMTTVLCRQEEAVKDLLGAGSELALAGLVALGRPLRQPRRLTRNEVGQFATLDRLDGPPFVP